MSVNSVPAKHLLQVKRTLLSDGRFIPSSACFRPPRDEATRYISTEGSDGGSDAIASFVFIFVVERWWYDERRAGGEAHVGDRKALLTREISTFGWTGRLARANLKQTYIVRVCLLASCVRGRHNNGVQING